MAGNVIVRDASENDLPAILESYNAAVVNETSIWHDEISDLADRQVGFKFDRWLDLVLMQKFLD
jgi:L-amino acid N-acyltransferase YncA